MGQSAPLLYTSTSTIVVVLLQAGPGQLSNGIAAGMLFLTLLFFLLPAAFIIADQMQRRQEPSKDGRLRRTRTRSVRDPAKWLVIRDSDKSHPFRHERPPPQHAMLPHDVHAKQGFDHRGHLVIGDRCQVDGDLRVIGTLAIGNASEVRGDVRVDGDLYVDSTALITGTAHVQGDVYMSPWSRAGRVEAMGDVHVDAGVDIAGGVRATGLRRANTIERSRDAPRAEVIARGRDSIL